MYTTTIIDIHDTHKFKKIFMNVPGTLLRVYNVPSPLRTLSMYGVFSDMKNALLGYLTRR